MIGKLTIEKASLNMSYFLASIRILSDAGGILSRSDFISAMANFLGQSPVMPDGKENRTPYNKTKFPRYFGFIDVNNDGDLILTARGKLLDTIIEHSTDKDIDECYSIAVLKQYIFKELFLESIAFDTFGKNNCGAEQSKSDVEPPKLILRAINDLGYATKQELGFVLWGLDEGIFESYDDALSKVIGYREDPSACNYDALINSWGKVNFVSDFKLLDILASSHVDFIQYDQRLKAYSLSLTLTEAQRAIIASLSPIYRPLQLFISGDNSVFAKQQWTDNAILGRYGDKSNIFHCNAHRGGDNAEFHIALAESLAKAYSNPKNNVVLVISGDESYDNLFQHLNVCFNRKDEYKSASHGDSIRAMYMPDLAEEIIKLSPKCARIIPQNEVFFPGNLNVIGVSSMNNVGHAAFVNVYLNNQVPQNTNPNCKLEEPLQKITYGAPGTGKSHGTNEKIKEANIPDDSVFRTTFHPDSDYSTFVGAYKPTMNGGKIVYSFRPQAFINAYVKAWEDTTKPVVLVIEEINRGNCAQIFGDLFQLLDRDDNGFSKYPITPDADLASWLKDKVSDATTLKLPPNLYIWATMNTSDQSLFPIDSAFKRRWDWKYVPIIDAKKGYEIKIGDKTYNWYEDFLKKINKIILSETLSADKQLGYFFVKLKEGGTTIDVERFVNKVLFYLWTDVFKDCDLTSELKKFSFGSFFKEGSAEVDEESVIKFLDAVKASEQTK